MRNDDLVYVQVPGGNFDWERYGFLCIEIDLIAVIYNVPLRAGCRSDLFGDRLFFPSIPSQADVRAYPVELPALTIEEKKDVVLEHRDEVAKFFAIRLKRI